jgi:hypothetical protein
VNFDSFPCKIFFWHILSDIGRVYNKISKQAGAELCQAQAQLGLPAEAELILTVEFKILAILEKTYNCYQLYFAGFQLIRPSSIEIIFHGCRLPSLQKFQNCFGLQMTQRT